MLEGRDQFPLFESAPEHYSCMLSSRHRWIRSATSNPLRRRPAGFSEQGIDVIFVPVPKMTEVYPEYFTDHCPSDRIIAPRVRQAVLELLEADVEVVDLWYAFQAGTGQGARAALSACGSPLGAAGPGDRRSRWSQRD